MNSDGAADGAGLAVARLDELAAEGCAYLTNIGSNILKLGRVLNEGRALLPSDEAFGRWRSASFQIAQRSAHRAMEYARMVDTSGGMEGVTATVADTNGSIEHEALNYLVRDGAEEDRDAVIAVKQSGVLITLADAKKLVEDRKAAKAGTQTCVPPQKSKLPVSRKLAATKPSPSVAPQVTLPSKHVAPQSANQRLALMDDRPDIEDGETVIDADGATWTFHKAGPKRDGYIEVVGTSTAVDGRTYTRFAPPPPPKVVTASEHLSSLAQSLKSRFDAAMASAWNFRTIEAFAPAIAHVDAAIALLDVLAKADDTSPRHDASANLIDNDTQAASAPDTIAPSDAVKASYVALATAQQLAKTVAADYIANVLKGRPLKTDLAEVARRVIVAGGTDDAAAITEGNGTAESYWVDARLARPGRSRHASHSDIYKVATIAARPSA